DPVSDHWFQETFFGKKAIRDLGVFEKGKESIREVVDTHTRHRYWAPPSVKQLKGTTQRRPVNRKLGGASKSTLAMTAVLAKNAAPLEAAMESSNSKANSWRAQIESLKKTTDYELL